MSWMDWKPTHKIFDDTDFELEVMLAGGALYTKDEWSAIAAADYELVNGVVYFLGEPTEYGIEEIR